MAHDSPTAPRGTIAPRIVPIAPARPRTPTTVRPIGGAWGWVGEIRPTRGSITAPPRICWPQVAPSDAGRIEEHGYADDVEISDSSITVVGSEALEFFPG
eukprot:2510243-Pyramimonas_sp.AAC.1